MVYLDNAATTFPKPENVYVAMDKVNRQLAFNSGRGSYAAAREATKIVDETKGLLLRLIKAEGVGKVAFTPSITIALNEILRGIDFKQGDNLYVSPYEHNAVARVAYAIEKEKKINVIQMPLKNDSLEIDLDRLQYQFSKNRPKAVCCIHVSNVTGYVLPIKEIFDYAKPYNAITVLDTAQSLGVVDIDALTMNLDFLAFAGHKTLYGPFGIGGFVDLKGTKLEAVIAGGTGSNSLNLEMPKESPFVYESSSLNIVAVAGLNAALKSLDIETNAKHESELLDYLIERMKMVEGAVLYLPPRDRHISILSFNLKKYRAEEVSEILDADFDIAVRSGYHCAPYVHAYIQDGEYSGTVRVGLGRFTTKDDIDCLVDALAEL